MKKRMSGVLAAIMFISAVLGPFGPASDVHAAVTGTKFGFNAIIDRTMPLGLNKITPTEMPADVLTDGCVQLEWTLQGSETGTYTLIYPLDNHKVIRVDVVKRDSGYADVSYRVYGSIADAENKANEMRPTPPGYGVHLADAPGYITNSDVTDETVAMMAPLWLDNTSGAAPSFTIRAEAGFSFYYFDNYIHFLWTGGTFKISTDGVSAGRIYNFTLDYVNSVGVPNNTDLTVFTGINMSTFSAAPYARDWRYEQGYTTVLDTTPDTAAPTAPNPTWHDSSHSLLMPDDYDEKSLAAGTENRIQVQFDLPFAWDDTTNSYSERMIDVAQAKGAGTSDIPDFTFIFKLDDTHIVQFNNVLGNTVDTSNPGNPSFRLKTASLSNAADIVENPESLTKVTSVEANTNTVTFTVTDLPAGTLYNSAYVLIAPEAGRTVAKFSQYLERYSVYTFINYEILYENEVYYAVFQPYAGAVGDYELITRLTGNPAEPVENRVIQTSDGNAEMRMVVNATLYPTPVRKWHQIRFIPTEATDKNVWSQPTAYTPSEKDIRIGRPNNFGIDSYEMTPDTDDFSESTLIMNMHWDVASKDTLRKLINDQGAEYDVLDEFGDPTGEIIKYVTVGYELNRMLSPSAKPGTADIYGIIEVAVALDDRGDPVLFVGHPDYDGGVKWLWGSNFELLPGAALLNSMHAENTAALYISVKVPAVHRFSSLVTYADFYYPNIYFLNVKSIASQNWAYSGLSMNDVLVLDDYSRLSVTPPQNFTFTEPVPQPVENEIRLNAAFTAPYQTIQEYLRDNSLPEDAERVKVATFNLYLSRSEEVMLAFSNEIAAVNSGSQPPANNPKVMAIDGGAVGAGISGGEITLSDAAVNWLRDGNIICVMDIPFDPSLVFQDARLAAGINIGFRYSLIGFDKNQKYYAAMCTVLTYYDVEEITDPNTGDVSLSYDFNKIIGSDLTGIQAVTTYGDLVPPNPAEKAPAAPVLSVEEAEDTWAALTWPYVGDEDEIIEYEVIRTTVPIEDENLNIKLPFSEFYGRYTPDDSAKAGYRRMGTETRKYASGAWGATNDASVEYTADFVRLTDRSLIPNTLYYYYVRSVKIIEGVDVNYSVWSAVSVTTNVVNGPVNLKVLRQNVSYDPKTEVVIQFDAPMTSISQLNTDYKIQISIREGSGEWSTPTTITSFYNGPVASPELDGYFRFTYKITGLRHNTGYSIRVRMLDKNGQPSMWSNVAETRTELDQEEYDKQHDITGWLDLLKAALEDEFKDEYWYLAASEARTSLFYRPRSFGMVLQNAAGGQINVYAEGIESIEFYIPAASYDAATAANKGFSVRNGNMSAVIPSGAINSENSALSGIYADIKANRLADYYVCVTVTFSPVYNNTMDRYEIAGNLCDVRIEIVGTTKSSTATDADILNMLFEKLANESFYATPEDEIKRMIERNSTNEELARYVDGYVQTAKQKLVADANAMFSASLQTSYTVTEFNAPVIVSLDTYGGQQTVKGYRQISYNSYNEETVFPYGSGYAIKTATPGGFVFTKHDPSADMPGFAENILNPGDMAALFSKYGLADFFDTGKDFDLNKNIGTGAVQGVVARLAGAGKNDDPQAWLRNKGYSTGKTAQSAITQQEALYYIMALYEMKTGKTIDSIQIRNYGATSNISGIEPRYLKSVQAAFEIGVYDNKNMNPKGGMTVKEFLNILSRLNGKLKL